MIDNICVEVRVPTYRRPKLLRRALVSIIEQTHTNWICVVLDDEMDGTDAEDVCHSLKDKRIIYTRNINNLGISKNIDLAFSIKSISSAKYICVLEDDNYFLPNYFESNILICESSSIDVVMRNMLIEHSYDAEGFGQLSASTMYSNQYIDGIYSKYELWGVFFYSLGTLNSGLFWRANSGLSFSVKAVHSDPVFQERFRTLCIDRSVYIAMEPLAVWRNNGAYSYRKRTKNILDFFCNACKNIERRASLI